MAKRIKDLGQTAGAITDHGEVNQHLAFQKACRQEGVKPLFGMEGYWAPDIKFLREYCKGENSGKWGSMMSHICLIAKTNDGLRNLWALSSKAYDEEHFFHRPMADPALMREYAADMFGSDGCIMTGLGKAIKAGDEDAARQYLGTLQSIFDDRLYVELHTWQYMHPSDDEWVKWEGEPITTVAANKMMTDLNQAKVRLATEMGVPMVVVNDAHHAYPEHWKFKEMVWGFKKDNNPDQQEGSGQKADHIMGDDELYYWMDRHGVSRNIVAEAIRYSGHIAEQCNVEIKPMLEMPQFTQSEADDFELFLKKVEAGFKAKVEQGGLPRDKYWQRMETEVAMIAQKRFAGYFLVVEDYVRAARDGTWAQYVTPGSPLVPMMIGPGRGSAGGSLVAWLLGITSIDPLKYGLLFERFLAPGRKGYPDIDIDFPRSKRKGVRDYVRQRWGEDRVCSICTMTRNQAKASVWDLARSLGIDNVGDLTTIAKLVDNISKNDWEEEGGETAGEDDKSWPEIMEENYQELSPWIRKYPELFDNLNYVHGIIRSWNVHAAAVLISKEPFAGRIPTRIKNGTLMTQFDMYAVEELGGLKGDFLALRHLDALEITRDLVKQRHGIEIDYEAFDAEWEDPNIWAQIDDGQTVGIFQIGTSGGTDAAIEFRPRSMVDVADLISINRPGVRDAGLYHVYLRRRAGQEAVAYDHPLMESITKDTYGVLVYQEQLMHTARELAGFTPDEADDLRKAVGKKLMDKVLALKQKFIQGCQNNPDYALGCGDPVNQTLYPEREVAIAEKIWASIEASGRYCFNKSHAIGYAMIATWEIWVKHYYPAEFLVACMQVDEVRRNKFIRDARRRDLTILAPDVNLSGQNFTIEGNSIRYGLQAITGVGPAAASALVAKQPYESLDDFLGRGKPNKTAALALAKLGSLDCFGDRAEILKKIEYYRATKDLAKSTLGNPEKLAKILADRFAKPEYAIDIPNFADPKVVYEIEQELVGSFVTIDPMGAYLKIIDQECIRSAASLRNFLPGQKLCIGGQIVKKREVTIKRGRQTGKLMCFLGVEWQGENYDITMFPPAYDKYKMLLKMGAPVICGCERLAPRDDRDGGVSLLKLFRLDIELGNNGDG